MAQRTQWPPAILDYMKNAKSSISTCLAQLSELENWAKHVDMWDGAFWNIIHLGACDNDFEIVWHANIGTLNFSAGKLHHVHTTVCWFFLPHTDFCSPCIRKFILCCMWHLKLVNPVACAGLRFLVIGVSLSEPRVVHCFWSFCVVCASTALAWSRFVLTCSALHARNQQIVVVIVSSEHVDGATIKSWQQR